jgi:hypothetical protein
MNKKYFLGLAFATVVGISFTACVKDTDANIPSHTDKWILVGLLREFNSCQKSVAICIRANNLPDDVVRTYPLEKDEALSKPLASSDGSLTMELEMDTDQLTEEARFQLFQEKALVVTEDFVVGKEIMQQAYENAGIPYNGQQLEVLKGAYRVYFESDSTGAEPQRIIITITIHDGVITITIRW